MHSKNLHRFKLLYCISNISYQNNLHKTYIEPPKNHHSTTTKLPFYRKNAHIFVKVQAKDGTLARKVAGFYEKGGWFLREDKH